ncbi:MAG: HlyD family type I secretion periplasmic adaptor subunit [Rickettsiales bacterium]|nr:HlyD family type I secretion periplasmic adaptor subunit [Rickettsiales bacterium]
MGEESLPLKAETAQIPADQAIDGSAQAAAPDEMQSPLEKVMPLISRVMGLLDYVNNWMAPASSGGDTPNDVTRQPIIVGGWMMIFVFGFLGLWAAFAPLASAAIAPGKIILSGNKKTIQHLEGGIVEEIYVREGQTIKAGQPLIRLNETAARARMDLFGKQYQTARATEARLIAERDDTPEIAFPDELLNPEKPTQTLTEIIISQKRLFESRRASVQGQAKVLEQKKAQFREEIVGLQAQIDSASEQIALLAEEIRAVRKLLKQGNAQKPRLLALQRQQASLKGDRGNFKARISRAEQSIAEADLQIINGRNEFANKVATEKRETVDKIADLQERLKASADIIDRIIINAPLSGIITALKVHTIGGVIRPGDAIMEIVPIDELLVEAKVSPQDIDVVRPGLKARVMLSAYATRRVPPLNAEVIHVSPDRFEDKRTGMPYYSARIRVSEKALEENEGIHLSPGMPADTLIVTGERSVLSYLMTPITDSFRKAFREE